MPDAAEEEEDEEAREEKKAKAEAEEQKKVGSEAYKKRDFDAAAAAFSKAWELWPKDITFLTNLSGESLCPLASPAHVHSDRHVFPATLPDPLSCPIRARKL